MFHLFIKLIFILPFSRHPSRKHGGLTALHIILKFHLDAGCTLHKTIHTGYTVIRFRPDAVFSKKPLRFACKKMCQLKAGDSAMLAPDPSGVLSARGYRRPANEKNYTL
jgi:hypothetical protein